MRVTFVAAPLTARSGVYRSARELVAAGRLLGYEWSLLLGVSADAGGSAPEADQPWVREFVSEPAGVRGVRNLRDALLGHHVIRDADVVVSLIPQSDMAMAMSDQRWVSFLRGLPWPARGEARALKRLPWRVLETVAMRRAREVWVTTPKLQAEVGTRISLEIVPAGVQPVPRTWDGRGSRTQVVWAARYDKDKNPRLLLDVMRGHPLHAVMFGTGPLEADLCSEVPPNVDVAGWADPGRLWEDALVYIGTSHREAFGRSALEAAMSGVPVIMSDAFGVAPLLVTDPEFRDLFVLPVDRVDRWRRALDLLQTDEELRIRYSQHLVDNAAAQTIVASANAVNDRLTALAD